MEVAQKHSIEPKVEEKDHAEVRSCLGLLQLGEETAHIAASDPARLDWTSRVRQDHICGSSCQAYELDLEGYHYRTFSKELA